MEVHILDSLFRKAKIVVWDSSDLVALDILDTHPHRIFESSFCNRHVCTWKGQAKRFIHQQFILELHFSLEVAHSSLATFCLCRKNWADLYFFVFAQQAADLLHNFKQFKFDLRWVKALDHDIHIESLFIQAIFW